MYELIHGDPEAVSHRFLLNQYAELRAMHERVLGALAQLDKSHHDLESQHTQLSTRIAAFAKGVNGKFAALKK